MKKYGCVIKEGEKYKLAPEIVIAENQNEAGKVFEEDYVVESVFVYKDGVNVDENDGSILL